jgi:hypothetical protein
MDYSGHLIKANQLMRNVYDLCQNNNYMTAMEQCLEAITEIKMAYNAINHMVSTNDPDQIIGDWKNELPTMPR